MVVSKKCKICATLDPNNVSISGEYFGKLIPDLILKTCGIELDLRKANGVLICQSCIIQLILTDVVTEKLRKALQRLKKNEKNSKLKTSSKDSSAVVTNDAVCLNNTKNSEEQQNKAIINNFQSYMKESKTPKTPKKVVRRKSTALDEKKTDALEGNNHKAEISNVVNNVSNAVNKFQKIADNDATTIKAPKRILPPLTDGDVVDPAIVKRKKKTLSLSEEAPMDLTVDEQEEDESKNESGVKGNKVKVMNCIICGKAFNSKIALRIHIEKAHVGEPLKACPHCSTEFRSKQKYDSHTFSEKCKNSSYACQYTKCNKRFKTVQKMELHMQEKHSPKKESALE